MRHRKAGRKLNRNSSHRKAMFRNMVTSLLKHDRIQTTDAKAKELRILADHIVTLAKRGDLHARRQALSIVRENAVVHKIFEEAGERFGSIAGGYTRIVKIGRRPGDAAPMSIIELVGRGTDTKKKKAEKKKSKPVGETIPAAAADAPVEPAATEAATSEAPPAETDAGSLEATPETAEPAAEQAAEEAEQPAVEEKPETDK